MVQKVVRAGDIPSFVHLIEDVSLYADVDVTPEGCHEIGVGDDRELTGEQVGHWNVERCSEGDYTVARDLRHTCVGETNVLTSKNSFFSPQSLFFH